MGMYIGKKQDGSTGGFIHIGNTDNIEILKNNKPVNGVTTFISENATYYAYRYELDINLPKHTNLLLSNYSGYYVNSITYGQADFNMEDSYDAALDADYKIVLFTYSSPQWRLLKEMYPTLKDIYYTGEELAAKTGLQMVSSESSFGIGFEYYYIYRGNSYSGHFKDVFYDIPEDGLDPHRFYPDSVDNITAKVIWLKKIKPEPNKEILIRNGSFYAGGRYWENDSYLSFSEVNGSDYLLLNNHKIIQFTNRNKDKMFIDNSGAYGTDGSIFPSSSSVVTGALSEYTKYNVGSIMLPDEYSFFKVTVKGSYTISFHNSFPADPSNLYSSTTFNFTTSNLIDISNTYSSSILVYSKEILGGTVFVTMNRIGRQINLSTKFLENYSVVTTLLTLHKEYSTNIESYTVSVFK